VPSKLLESLEQLVVRQLLDYPSSANLLPSLQSCFRPGHSTETATLHVLSEISWLSIVVVAALSLLDLSAAFDTVNHDILLQRLQTSFTILLSAPQWFRSYLLGRTQYVDRGATNSIVIFSRSVAFHRNRFWFGPILFILYTTQPTILHLRQDSDYYRICTPTTSRYSAPARRPTSMSFCQTSNECDSVVASWMHSNRLWTTIRPYSRRQQHLPAGGSTVVSLRKTFNMYSNDSMTN